MLAGNQNKQLFKDNALAKIIIVDITVGITVVDATYGILLLTVNDDINIQP